MVLLLPSDDLPSAFLMYNATWHMQAAVTSLQRANFNVWTEHQERKVVRRCWYMKTVLQLDVLL